MAHCAVKDWPRLHAQQPHTLRFTADGVHLQINEAGEEPQKDDLFYEYAFYGRKL